MFQKKCCIVLLTNLYQVLVTCEAKSSIIVKLNVQPSTNPSRGLFAVIQGQAVDA